MLWSFENLLSGGTPAPVSGPPGSAASPLQSQPPIPTQAWTSQAQLADTGERLEFKGGVGVRAATVVVSSGFSEHPSVLILHVSSQVVLL